MLTHDDTTQIGTRPFGVTAAKRGKKQEMKILAALCVSAALAAGGLVAPAHAQQSNAVDVQQAQEDLAFAVGVAAYCWAYPLVITAATAEVATSTDKPLPNGHAPFNMFGHVGKLITAADRDVVAANVDTVYSSAFLDLKQGAALVSVPDTGDRY